MLNIRKSLTTRKGLTLVEVMVATSILAIILLVAANVMITGQQATASSQQQTLSVNLAQGLMEEILAQEVQNISPKGLTNPEAFTEAPGYKYTYKIEDYVSDNNLWAITVSVFYDDNGQRKNEVTLYTLKRKGA
ncbi:MAG: type IV pilus modification PilV family protein [Bacillota bacterium]